MQPGGVAQSNGNTGQAEGHGGSREAPPSVVGVLLASEVSDPGSSDPSSAGGCGGDSGTYTVSPQTSRGTFGVDAVSS